VWRRGSVVASWLLDLTAQAFANDAKLEQFAGRVSDSGEGRWTLQASIDEGVPAHVLSAALFRPLRVARRGRLRQQGALGDAPSASAGTWRKK
jgi:6-phosphogluconate dehydrogenase